MRTIRLGSRGTDVLAVKRALHDAGYSGFTLKSKLYGVGCRNAVKLFQRKHLLAADGVYGPVTHSRLAAFFDAQAWELWPPLVLPLHFAATHETSGLPGYPAVDLFAPGGTRVVCGFNGVVRRLSGHDPTRTATPGGPYGFTCYVKPDAGGDDFVTHFGTRRVHTGDRIVANKTVLGTVADYAAATGGITPSHIHLGRHP